MIDRRVWEPDETCIPWSVDCQAITKNCLATWTVPMRHLAVLTSLSYHKGIFSHDKQFQLMLSRVDADFPTPYDFFANELRARGEGIGGALQGVLMQKRTTLPDHIDGWAAGLGNPKPARDTLFIMRPGRWILMLPFVSEGITHTVTLNGHIFPERR